MIGFALTTNRYDDMIGWSMLYNQVDTLQRQLWFIYFAVHNENAIADLGLISPDALLMCVCVYYA